ncbi:Alkaline protease 1-like protein 3 [Colletotrichum plurivorum]|uniref:Alkaline protease 1-like protein 3 n=1 Tax=Colletotrichum plurivorum TaxID=2175906 RepID=A0A8H6MZL1_9PEZI|nr:Alkaline protease 1-like protein 3 [Colletotrichum plurivorum]
MGLPFSDVVESSINEGIALKWGVARDITWVDAVHKYSLGRRDCQANTAGVDEKYKTSKLNDYSDQFDGTTRSQHSSLECFAPRHRPPFRPVGLSLPRCAARHRNARANTAAEQSGSASIMGRKPKLGLETSALVR